MVISSVRTKKDFARKANYSITVYDDLAVFIAICHGAESGSNPVVPTTPSIASVFCSYDLQLPIHPPLHPSLEGRSSPIPGC